MNMQETETVPPLEYVLKNLHFSLKQATLYRVYYLLRDNVSR